MKKIVYFLIILFSFIGITSAEKCIVVTGSGKNIGDEIACGTEHFYVISNDGENVKMLAKYNLLAGDIYEKITFAEITSTSSNAIYDSPEVRNKMEQGYSLYEKLYEYDKETKIYTIYGAIMYKPTKYEGLPAIFFNETKNNTEEILNDSKTAEMLSKGYKLYQNISYTSGYIGATFYKSEAYEYKTLVFNKQRISSKELYNKNEVKEKLKEGYVINDKYYEYKEGTAGEEQKYDYYGLVFSKSIYSDYVNYITEVEFSTKESLINYLISNTDYQEKINEGYQISDYYSNGYYSQASKYVGVILYKDTNKDLDQDYYTVLQDETAIGANGTAEGKPNPIEIGVVRYDAYDLYGYEIANGKEYNPAYYNYEFGTEEYDSSQNTWQYHKIQLYELELYEYTMKNMDYNIKEIGLLTIDDINNIVKNISAKELPLDTWAEESWEKIESNSILAETVYKIGSLKEYVPTEYSWLWGTTYWTQTMYVTNPRNNGINGYIYFVDTLGNICADYDCPLSIGAGIRPVITMSSNDIVYTIKTKTDGNGTITPSATTEHSGKEVTFIVTPNEGFELKEVKVTDSNGNIVTFTDYKFTMPNANVLIEASFIKEETNPPTSAFNIGIAIILCSISIIIFKNYKKKADWLNT